MRNVALACLVIAILSFASLADAGLQRFVSNSGDVVVYDNLANLAWMGNMSDSSKLFNKDYVDQLATVSTMNTSGAEFYGLRGWRIANETDLTKLVQNSLADIAGKFTLRVYGSTAEGMGRYENNVNPPAPGNHHTFNVTQLTCCEPFETGTKPYEQLIQNPGPSNDVFYYAVPVPTTGGPQSSDTHVYTLGAWVVTSQVSLSDGKLVPLRCWTIRGRTFCLSPFRIKILLLFASILIIGIGTWLWYRRRQPS